MELWIATTNRGKLLEFEMILEPLIKEKKLELKTLSELETYFPPEETGQTFLENARIKAKSLKAVRPGTWVVSDDSGLEVEGLGGLPGIHSARYAGPKASDFENRAKLLKIMGLKAMANRNAAFVCQMVVYDSDGNEYTFEGRLTGTIAKTEAGKTGFGYDSVFIPDAQPQDPVTGKPPTQAKTLAELGLAYKNQVSHRARAVEKLLDLLRQRS